jgi:hypothetical protein
MSFTDWYKQQQDKKRVDEEFKLQTEIALGQAQAQTQLAQMAQAARNAMQGGYMGGGGVGSIIGDAGNKYTTAAQLGAKKTDTDHFIVETIANGYLLMHRGERYYVEDKVALGNQVVVLLTTAEIQDGK